jgi:Protein of unknown function (DUF3822)
LEIVVNIEHGELKDKYGLVLDIGPDGCAAGMFQPGGDRIEALRYVAYKENEATAAVGQLITDWADRKFTHVLIGTSFPQSVLIPQQFYQADLSLLPLLFDDTGIACLHDRITEWQMVNAYAVPQPLLQLLQSAFPDAAYMHVFGSEVRTVGSAGDSIQVHVGSEYFRVVVSRGSQIQLAQIYGFKTPLDIIYYLLKIGYELGMPPEQTEFILSGRVNEDSELMNELRSYFSRLQFANHAAYRLPKGAFAGHLFHSLFKLASCGS